MQVDTHHTLTFLSLVAMLAKWSPVGVKSNCLTGLSCPRKDLSAFWVSISQTVIDLEALMSHGSVGWTARTLTWSPFRLDFQDLRKTKDLPLASIFQGWNLKMTKNCVFQSIIKVEVKFIQKFWNYVMKFTNNCDLRKTYLTLCELGKIHLTMCPLDSPAKTSLPLAQVSASTEFEESLKSFPTTSAELLL